MFPINQIVVEIEPENVPDEFSVAGEKALGGAFLFDGGKIIAAPVDYVAEAQRKKQELLSQANNMITTLQDAVDLEMATGDEAVSVLEWRKHRVLLSRVDVGKAPDIKWPQTP
ncbi:TPA: tail fiber assembly protein [Enterobacter asburiae]|uniref:Tail fiber assembly protein n=1 Tax=Enterobacter asburiae TaxID=61645 RepID=A0A8I1G5E0_ENTAS|nr:tail fiber assembly protein [Enterobacter asburiae]MBJ6598580.1 tail fiber assembly protein [Enterobacter asburiae]HAS1420568.1 tail fiber assembly protein [Enterobacter asburiae]HCD6061753.1 tail fiber assembly protein [Enterobacter asburiae]HCD8883566.1 tail fiber assembly protein [Enterobacter asburiae]